MDRPVKMHSITPSEARKFFPHTEAGKIYFNHAAISPLSTRVTDALGKYFTDRQTGSIDTYLASLPELDKTRTLVAQLIGASDPNQIAFVDNTGGTINRLTNGLAWKSSDEVVINSIEFPSNTMPFLALRRHGVNIIDAEVEGGAVSVDAIEKVLTPRTRIVSISFVQFLSGYRADLAAIGELCRKHGIIFCVDGIQGLGAVPLHVEKMKIDFLASASHKWMMAPEGLAILYLTKELQDKLIPTTVGWTSVEHAWNFFEREVHLQPNARRYEHGILNMPAIIGLKAALELFFEVGMEQVTASVLARSKELVEGITSMGYELCCKHVRDQERAGTVSFRTKSNPDDVAKRLEEKNIIVTARAGWLRVSPHFYCTSDDIDEFLEALNSIDR